MSDDNKIEKIQYCSFCGKSQHEVKKLIAGPGIYICDECIDLCNDILRDERVSTMPSLEHTTKKLITISNKFVPGQEEAKRLLAATIGEHLARTDSIMSSKLSSLLLVGPTGTGKRELVKSMAKAMDMSVVTFDVPLLYADSPFKAKHDLKNFSDKPGIILLDRIDSAAMRDNINLEAARLVQESLISILDGAVIRAMGAEEIDEIDSSKILFIGVGTFSDALSNKQTFDAQSLIRYGFLPDLAARFGTILQLDLLNVDNLKALLVGDGGMIANYQTRFEKSGLKLVFSDDAVDAIAALGEQRKTGARGLKAIMDSLALELAFVSSKVEDSRFVVDDKFVKQTIRK